jgi:hypothetical protein
MIKFCHSAFKKVFIGGFSIAGSTPDSNEKANYLGCFFLPSIMANANPTLKSTVISPAK